MRSPSDNQVLKLDPWAASSLLQKAIRRGEVDLARRAAVLLRQYRGQAIWRRLIDIAVEDIGIADVGLVLDIVRLGTDKQLRSLLGSDHDLLDDLCVRMTAAAKDRSADYLYCGATKLRTALHDRCNFDALAIEDRLTIATAKFEPLTRRAVAALSACTIQKSGRLLVSAETVTALAAKLGHLPADLLDLVTALTGRNSHPFGLMLLLIWVHCELTGGPHGYSKVSLPATHYIDGVPFYTFDKHTAVGKRAISELPANCAALRSLLTEWIPLERWKEVTLMAAFYADAAPVACKLDWFGSELLEFVGFNSDMVDAGCPIKATREVLDCVRSNLALLDELRRAAAIGSLRSR